MLREALEYLVTPGNTQARRLGYLHEMVALGARYRRNRHAWQPHIHACHDFIAEAVARLDQGPARQAGQSPRRLLLVGSGRLIEIPLDALAARFDEIILLDLVHPWPVRRRIRAYGGRVRLVAADCTGLLDQLEQTTASTADGSPGIGAINPPDVEQLGVSRRFDLALSCNILSQLPIAILNRISKANGLSPCDETTQIRLAQQLMTDHIRWLTRIADQSSLYCDMAGDWHRDGQTLDSQTSLFSLPVTPPDRQWDWDIAPAPEMDRWLGLRHQVGGWFSAASVLAPESPP